MSEIFILREQHRMKVFENRLLRIFRSKIDKDRKRVTEGWENCIMRKFIFCSLHQILLGSSYQGR